MWSEVIAGTVKGRTEDMAATTTPLDLCDADGQENIGQRDSYALMAAENPDGSCGGAWLTTHRNKIGSVPLG